MNNNFLTDLVAQIGKYVPFLAKPVEAKTNLQTNQQPSQQTPNYSSAKQAQGIYSPNIPNQVEYYPGTQTRVPVPAAVSSAWQQSQPTQQVTPTAPAVSNQGIYGLSDRAHSLKPSQDVIDAINNAAKAFNIPANLMFDVAAQESSFNPNTANNTPAGVAAGVPTGLFQFTPDTWTGLVNPNAQGDYGKSLRPYLQGQSNLDRTNPVINALAAAYLMSHGQMSRWNDSQGVWGPTMTQQEAMPYYSQSMQYMPNLNWKK